MGRDLSGACHWCSQDRGRIPKLCQTALSLSGKTEIRKLLLTVSQSWRSNPTNYSFSGRHFKVNEWVPFTYSMWVFQSGVFVLFFRSSKFLHEPFKSIFSIPFSSIAFLDIFIIGFQRQRLTSLLEDVRFLMPEVQLKFLALRGDDLYLYDPSLIWTAMAQCGFFLGKPKSLPFLPVLMLSCHPLLWRLYSSSFQVCFWGNYSICSCRFVVWKKVSSGSSYAAILNTLLSFSFQHFVIWILPWSKSIQLLLIRLVRASLILTQ